MSSPGTCRPNRPRVSGRIVLPPGKGKVLLGAGVLLASLASSQAEGALVRGFVSGQLLHAWCTRDTPADTEACYSYLRGVFDSLNALRNAGGDDEEGRIDAVRCIPDHAAVAELRTKFLRYAGANPDSGERQAADLLMQIFQESYPCD